MEIKFVDIDYKDKTLKREMIIERFVACHMHKGYNATISVTYTPNKVGANYDKENNPNSINIPFIMY